MTHSLTNPARLPAGPIVRTVLLLALLSAFVLALLAFRMDHTGSTFHRAFRWNLFLAWVPLGVALLAATVYRYKWLHLALLGPLFALWLLFFPNAPYLITDLVHIRKDKLMPYWYDVAMIFGFAFSGLLCGLFSLYLMQQQWARYLPRWLSYGLSLACLLLAGVGIYLGRRLLADLLDLAQRPGALVFVALHTALLVFSYGLLLNFMRFGRG
ncbi:MAG: DUF1361 domain-containing protein [Bernardetiaceae bacterium]|nr:DUF1361 domain-containing protein [Bernardetiaceae bacterium]